MTEKNQEPQTTGQGFAGLSSLVSDVEDDVAHLARAGQNSENFQTTTNRTGTPASTASGGGASALETEPIRALQRPTGDSSVDIWLLLISIGAVAIFTWMVFRSTSSPSRIYTSNTTLPAAASVQQTPQPPVSQSQILSRSAEERPPVANGNILSIAQLRYCLAESIRMSASKIVINADSNADVNRFNDTVADYNGRCGSSKYRSETLESAQAEVEAHRMEFEAIGRSRFVKSTSLLESPIPSAGDIDGKTPASNPSAQIFNHKSHEKYINPAPVDIDSTYGDLSDDTEDDDDTEDESE